MDAIELQAGDHYARIRSRLTSMIAHTTPAELELAVPACPGWRVRDVVGHLVGVVEDALAGRLKGPPDEATTAEQVARHRDEPIDAMLTEWERLAPRFEAAISDMGMWPAALDAISHEFDLCHALGRPAPRDDALVGVMAPMLAGRLVGHAELVLDGEPCAETPPSDVQLRVSSFEYLRMAMGRRTLAQAAALDWTGDAAPVLPHVFVFGPADYAIVE